MKKIVLSIALLSVLLTACNTTKSSTSSLQSQQLVSEQPQAVTDAPQKMKLSAANTQQQQAQLIQTSDRVLTKKVGGKSVEAMFEAAVGKPDTAR